MLKPALVCLVALPLLSLGLSLGACSALDPRLPATDPPPNVPDGFLLVRVPENEIALQARPEVSVEMQGWMREEPLPEAWRMQAVRESRLVTGMTWQEVTFAMRAHPTAVDEQGPPAGRTWMWDTCRYWTRFDIQGRLVAAGRY